jgi:hypothetical protein
MIETSSAISLSKCMTLEDNVMVNRFIESMGAARYETYPIYGKSLA